MLSVVVAEASPEISVYLCHCSAVKNSAEVGLTEGSILLRLLQNQHTRNSQNELAATYRHSCCAFPPFLHFARSRRARLRWALRSSSDTAGWVRRRAWPLDLAEAFEISSNNCWGMTTFFASPGVERPQFHHIYFRWTFFFRRDTSNVLISRL